MSAEYVWNKQYASTICTLYMYVAHVSVNQSLQARSKLATRCTDRLIGRPKQYNHSITQCMGIKSSMLRCIKYAPIQFQNENYLAFLGQPCFTVSSITFTIHKYLCL